MKQLATEALKLHSNLAWRIMTEEVRRDDRRNLCGDFALIVRLERIHEKAAERWRRRMAKGL